MKTALLITLFLVSFTSLAGNTVFKSKPYYGVDFSLIDIESYCANLKPVRYKGCDFPANTLQTRLDRAHKTYPTCVGVEKTLAFFQSDKRGGGCVHKMRNTLFKRHVHRGRFPESFEEWREKYFGPYIVE